MKIKGLKLTGTTADGSVVEIEANGIVDLDVKEFEDYEIRSLAHHPSFELESRKIVLTLKSVGLDPSGMMIIKVVEPGERL